MKSISSFGSMVHKTHRSPLIGSMYLKDTFPHGKSERAQAAGMNSLMHFRCAIEVGTKKAGQGLGRWLMHGPQPQ